MDCLGHAKLEGCQSSDLNKVEDVVRWLQAILVCVGIFLLHSSMQLVQVLYVALPNSTLVALVQAGCREAM